MQVVAGTVLLGIAYLIGHDHAALVVSGAQASGTIVGFKPEQIWSSRNNFRWTAYMPIVEYHVAGRAVRFEDWLSRRTETLGTPVPVLYEPANPTVAMIDRPVWNWIPWGPTALVAIVVLASGTIGLLRLARASD